MESSLEEAASRSEGRTGSEQRNRVGPEVSSSGAKAQGWELVQGIWALSFRSLGEARTAVRVWEQDLPRSACCGWRR